MLPLQQAYEVKKSVLAYITATFRFKEKDVDDAFHRLVDISAQDEQQVTFAGREMRLTDGLPYGVEMHSVAQVKLHLRIFLAKSTESNGIFHVLK